MPSISVPSIGGYVRITQVINYFVGWFNGFAQLLFETKIYVGSFVVSLGGLLLSGILISFVLSIFWKGANKH